MSHASPVGKLFWVVALLAALVGGFVGGGTVLFSNGAPQEAAGAAIGLLIAIVPYCIARAMDELTRS